MIDTFGKTQQKLLKVLLSNPEGRTLDDLSTQLNVTRTAVRQHVTALENQGYLQKGKSISSGGRPSQYYVLSEKGHNLFPKQYFLFSEILLNGIIHEKGSKKAEKWLKKLGVEVAQGFKMQIKGKSLRDKVVDVVSVMNALAYEAQTTQESTPSIEAKNCVYHNLAANHREVCKFDVALLTELSGTKVTHEKCIQDGDDVCRFCFKNKATET